MHLGSYVLLYRRGKWFELLLIIGFNFFSLSTTLTTCIYCPKWDEAILRRNVMIHSVSSSLYLYIESYFDCRKLNVEIKLARKLALIVGTDFLCWMPIIIMGLLSITRLAEIPPDVYAWTAVFILPLNSSINPYLYTYSIVLQKTGKSEQVPVLIMQCHLKVENIL